MAGGRPQTPFDQEIADELCFRWSSEVKGMRSILKDLANEFPNKTIPCTGTIYKWMEENPEFMAQSARAREMRADMLADERTEYALTPLLGEVVTESDKNGRETRTGDNVARSTLIVQTISRHIGQLNPRKYGDKVLNEHTGKDGAPIQFVTKSILEE